MNHWIDSPDALQSRLQSWNTPPAVALDTEFVRERTYYPQLALVQIAIPGEVLLVDPLVPGMATVLRSLLDDPRILKIMHSASEDLQAFLRGCGTVPSPLFDTQVAAGLAGFGAGLGYQKLVQQLTGQVLEKGETRSDWLRRPLSDSQLHYAAEDVLYLHELHAQLAAALERLDRAAWLDADCARAVRNARSDADDVHPHLALRSAQTLDGEGQARLCRLLRWRDAEARRLDRPKSWILDNELSVALARRVPEDFNRFNEVLDRHPKAPRKSRRELWDLLAAPLSEAELAIPLSRAEQVDKNQLKKMQEAVAGVAQSLDVPEGLLCSRKHLESLLEGRGWPDALAGWRHERLQAVLTPLIPAPA
ncbi:ribonuclease D [Arenimonas sp.]|uniref:ribonuclease D n=1 Tax=Arenimonas sp. TaxID=1872635 RepID=UPI0039E2DD84